MVPATALLVPRFVLFKQLGLIDTYVPLIAPALIGSPFYVLLFYWAFRRIPEELFEAARLEGLTPFQTWRRVAMPLVRPVTLAVGLLAFVFTWSNLLDPLIYLFNQERFTLPLGLKLLAQLDPQNLPLLLAGAVAATAPVVVAFLVAKSSAGLTSRSTRASCSVHRAEFGSSSPAAIRGRTPGPGGRGVGRRRRPAAPATAPALRRRTARGRPRACARA
jgi:multiple sugar transport system permease protein